MTEQPAQLGILNDLGILKVSGPDVLKFLQGQLTCDVAKIDATQASMGAHCNPQGRIISLFYIFQIEQAYYLLMPRTLISTAQTALKKYAVFYKTELSDATSEFTILGYRGPELKSTSISIKLLPDASLYFIVDKVSALKKTLEDFATSTPASSEVWHSFRMDAGIPLLYPETSGKFLPHDLNLQHLGAISFDKGCYTGQEIIARMHYRGKLKNHMYKAKIAIQSAPLSPGADIFCNKMGEKQQAGTIIEAHSRVYNEYRVLLLTDEGNARNGDLFMDDSTCFFNILE